MTSGCSGWRGLMETGEGGMPAKVNKFLFEVKQN